MHNLFISFYGRPLPLDDEEAINNVIAYLQAHKVLLAISRHVDEPSAVIEARIPSVQQVNSEVSDDENPSSKRHNRETIVENQEPDHGTLALESARLINWFEQAWVVLGQPAGGATGDQFFNALIKLGFQPTAEHPVAAIKTAIRVNPRFRKVGVTANNTALWKLKPRVPSAQSSSSELSIVPGKTTGYKGPSLNHPPAVGQRVIDYAIKAWQSFGEGVLTEQLAARMVQQGWVTAGDPVRTLASTLRKPRYNSTFIRVDGLWWYRNDDNFILVPDETQEQYKFQEEVDLALEQKVSADKISSQITKLF